MGYSRREAAFLAVVVLTAIAWAGPRARAAEPIFRDPALAFGNPAGPGAPTGSNNCERYDSDCICECYPYLPGEFSNCCPPQRPVWYVQAEGILLKRDPSQNQLFQALVERTWTEDGGVWSSTDTVTPVLGTGDLDFCYHGGGRFLIGRTLGNCHAVEVSYFTVADWDQMAFVRDDTEFVETVQADGTPDITHPASLFSPFSDFGDPPIPALDYNDLAEISYSSSLDNLEWNFRRWMPMPCDCFQVSLLVGGRYMSIDERFNYYTESDVPADDTITDITTWTENSMVGVQIGAMFEFYVDPCWWIDCEIKGAVFNNSASQDTNYYHDGEDSGAYADDATRGRTECCSSFVLDLNLTATWQVTPRLAVMGGYQALWVDGLFLASANMARDPDTLIDGPAALIGDGKVTYHGPHLGGTFAW
jgi:hypothetical protein